VTTKVYRRPLAVSTTVLIAGIAASLAGNLQAINLGDRHPGIGSYVSAVIWPMFLFGAIEVMLHTPWVKSWRDGLTKWAGLTLVAFVSFWISYWHMAHVLAAYGYDTVSSHLGPLAIDMTMAMATLALNRVGQARRVSTLTAVAIVDTAVDTPAYVATAEDVAESEAAFYATVAREDTADTYAEDVAMPDEIPSWMDGLADRVDNTTTPAAPLDIVPVSAPPAPTIPLAAFEAFEAWRTAPWAERPPVGQMIEWVAADAGRSPRTVRRWFTAANRQGEVS
jgi:hypothetical protein